MWRKKSYLLIVFFCCVCLLFLPLREGRSDEPVLSIEKLTAGKVKAGDTITKKNVDLVKNLISDGVYELVKGGMVMVIGTPYAPWESTPGWYRAETEKIHKEYGDPILDENLTPWTRDHKTWPGGLAFPNPKTVEELVASTYYYHGADSYRFTYSPFIFVDAEGKVEKISVNSIDSRYIYGRLNEAPLGTVPGMEKEDHRTCTAMKYPREIKGLGQLTIRYYEVGKYPDEGFAYIPAFKRVLRVSATTYQDNMAGGDMTWGDVGGGLYEPQYYFTFKLREKKPILVPDYNAPLPTKLEDKNLLDIHQPWDSGMKYPRLNWRLIEGFVVESTPKVSHVYGKRIQYLADPKYILSFAGMCTVGDRYDRPGKLWKTAIADGAASPTLVRGEKMSGVRIQNCYDLQTKHSTMLLNIPDYLNNGGNPGGLTLKYLTQTGR